MIILLFNVAWKADLPCNRRGKIPMVGRESGSGQGWGLERVEIEQCTEEIERLEFRKFWSDFEAFEKISWKPNVKFEQGRRKGILRCHHLGRNRCRHGGSIWQWLRRLEEWRKNKWLRRMVYILKRRKKRKKKRLCFLNLLLKKNCNFLG